MRSAGLQRTIRGRLIVVTLALLVPAVAVAAALLWRAYTIEHDAAERRLLDTARALSMVMDGEIERSIVLLDALSASALLGAGDFAGFHAQVQRANHDPTRWVAAFDHGRQLLNSRVPYGPPLPDIGDRRSSIGYRVLPGGVRLWNLIHGKVARRPIVTVMRSVRLKDGRVIDLSVATRADAFARLFTRQGLPERSTGVVLDARRQIVARNRAPEQFVGRGASIEMRARINSALSGVGPSVTLDGIPSITAWHRSANTDWVMIVAVPRSDLAAGARSSLISAALFGVFLLGIGVIVAYRVGRGVAQPLAQLASVATAVGRGEASECVRSPLAEIRAVQDALLAAGTALRAREQELQQLNETLEQRVAQRTAELEQATTSLVQAQKMEAIGRLTGGIAHDFNNLLTAVLGNIDLVQRGGTDERTGRLLGNARLAAERGAKLTGQLLAFSRRQQLSTEAIDVAATVENAAELIEGTLGGSIAIERAPMPALWTASADPTQLDLILLNLAINARDAMPGGGTIRISAENATLTGGPATSEEPGPGDYVAVTIADDGTGMSEEVRARAFDPFFTTKPLGQGTGLGLPQVLGILKQSGGGVRIDSRLGEGTRVTIFLPRSDDAVRAATAETRTVGDLDGLTILLVDDDPDVRGVAQAMLRDLGCTVIETCDGDGAIEAARGGRTLDLALLDYAMPGRNGAEIALALRALDPALPILLMSGFADADALAELWCGPLLPKPFTADSLKAGLVETLRQA